MARTIWDDIKNSYQQGNAVTRLLIANIAIFVVLGLIQLPFFFFGDTANSLTAANPFKVWISEWLYLPAALDSLMYRPWTFLTSIFLHNDFFHLFWNMLMLYWFGRVLNDFLPSYKVFPLFLLGGFVGGLVFVLSYNLFPVFAEQVAQARLVGASAGIMAIVIAAAVIAPHIRFRLLFIGEIEIQYIALFLVVLDLLLITNNPGGRLAHVGGALMGWFYISQARKGRDLSRPINKTINLFAKPFRRNKPQPTRVQTKKEHHTVPIQHKVRVYETKEEMESNYSRSFLMQYRNMSQEECMNAILDKINQSGYDSLSADEKKFLHQASQQK